MKILDLLRRPLVRYFGLADTSVPPKIGSQAANPQLDALIASLTSFNADVRTMIDKGTLGNPVELPNPFEAPPALPSASMDDIREQIEKITGRKVARISVVKAEDHDAEAKRPGIKPPDPMPWETWRTMMAAERVPGWSPCMIGNRGERGAKFVYGLARDQIGMYRMPFDCCLQNEDHTESDMGEKVLTALVHLPTGLGMGVFETQADAALATDLMLPVVKDWTALDPDDYHGPNGLLTWLMPIQTAWKFGGLRPHDDYHAHDQGSSALAVWHRSDVVVNAGRPEKLS